MAYTGYTRDGTYWTLRKRADWYVVCRLRSVTYDELERYGWYRRPGAAATAVGALSYRAALAEVRDTAPNDAVRGDAQRRLDEMPSDAVPEPDRAADDAPPESPEEDPDQSE